MTLQSKRWIDEGPLCFIVWGYGGAHGSGAHGSDPIVAIHTEQPAFGQTVTARP
ncbi:MAG: hypothetical protein ACO4AI_05605 [Prochlorothrix sp.]|nr:hypothetical protein [Prochlorothrix sp.]